MVGAEGLVTHLDLLKIFALAVLANIAGTFAVMGILALMREMGIL